MVTNFGTNPEREAAKQWLTKVADDKTNPDSKHATIILKRWKHYIEKCGEID